MDKINSNGNRNKVNISNSLFDNWDQAIFMDTPMDDASDIYDIFIENNKMVNANIALNMHIKGNHVLRNNVIFNNIDYLYSYSNIFTSEGNILIDNLTTTNSSWGFESYRNFHWK